METGKQDSSLSYHIKRRITRKPNRVIKRSFIESAMCNHNIVMLLIGMLVVLGMTGLAIMPKQEMPQFTVRQGACVAVYPGATSAEVEERVAKPLENFIFGYKEVNKKKTYTQSKDGMLIVFLELNDNVEDRDAFWSKFKHGLQAFKASLPAGVVALQAVDDSYNNECDVAEQIVYSDPKGNIVRLKDIARITREYPKQNKYIESNGNKCVLLSIEMRPGNDIVKMGKDVHKALENFEQTLPEDVRITTITDQSKVVSESVLNFLRELLISVISVIVVVVLLMPRRVAEVSALSIPVTIFSSVGIFYFFSMELNTVTLAALIVTLGMVVDDSVVIIDNYMEKLGHGMSRWHAAIAAPREFFMSVLSATLSISLTVSIVLTPYLQYTLIHKGIDTNPKPNARKKPLDYLQTGYTWLLNRCFNHPCASPCSTMPKSCDARRDSPCATLLSRQANAACAPSSSHQQQPLWECCR